MWLSLHGAVNVHYRLPVILHCTVYNLKLLFLYLLLELRTVYFIWNHHTCLYHGTRTSWDKMLGSPPIWAKNGQGSLSRWSGIFGHLITRHIGDMPPFICVTWHGGGGGETHLVESSCSKHASSHSHGLICSYTPTTWAPSGAYQNNKEAKGTNKKMEVCFFITHLSPIAHFVLKTEQSWS